MLGDTRELSKVFFETVSVKQIDDATNKIFEELVEQVQELKNQGKDSTKFEFEIEKRIAGLYEITDSEMSVISS